MIPFLLWGLSKLKFKFQVASLVSLIIIGSIINFVTVYNNSLAVGLFAHEDITIFWFWVV